MPGVEVEGLGFRHGKGPDILGDLSLMARPGEILGLLGVNGAGKTTLFRLIAGLLKPRTGRIRVADIDVAEDRREASRRLGFVPDEPLLYPRMSALENLNQFAVLWGVPGAEARHRSEALLRETSLWEERNTWVEGFSRGMRQKLALSCALLHQPPVLVLDEPFNGLDMSAVLWLRDLLRRRAEAGDCILLSSHQPEALDALADRLAVLHQGELAGLYDRAEVARRGGTAEIFHATCGPKALRAGEEREPGA
ncbi:ATP-binding cassette domain-containing protein [Myxococcus sp. Y35]|uniref:ABC transporter ATP-binding protein n=1 Tax=Pseudomyxococcus flavus TaxID=3115648 RepID=UPI003CE7F130